MDNGEKDDQFNVEWSPILALSAGRKNPWFGSASASSTVQYNPKSPGGRSGGLTGLRKGPGTTVWCGENVPPDARLQTTHLMRHLPAIPGTSHDGQRDTS